MPNYRRAREGSRYFFTAATHQRRPILWEERARAASRGAIAETRASHPFVIEAWVLLPDHLHCFLSLPDGDTDYSIRWALIKRGVHKASLVVAPEDWPWSTFHRFVRQGLYPEDWGSAPREFPAAVGRE